VAVDDTDKFSDLLLRYHPDILGWRYTTDHTEGIDWLSHQSGDASCTASAQTAHICVLDKQSVFEPSHFLKWFMGSS